MRALPGTAWCFLLCLAAVAGPRLPAAECEGFGDLPPAGEVPGPDCDQDGVPDECAIAGKFAFTAVKFSLGLGDPFLLASGDLDGDGDADLVSLDRAREICLLINAGDGLDFEARRMDLPRASLGLAVADMDGDGLADVVLTAPSSLRVLRNAGDAVFRPPDEISLSANPVTVAASDLDGDGAPDLAVAGRVGAEFDDIVSILTNATGSFSAPRNFGVHRGVRWLTARDLDRDGDLDLAVASDGQGADANDDRDGVAGAGSGAGAISILWNGGAGAFRPAETFDPGMFPAWIDAADIDGDGDGDLVATGITPVPQRNVLESFRNSGGVFEPAVTITEGERILAVLDDLDSDGDPDIAATRPSMAEVELLANDGSGRFSRGGATLTAGSEMFLLAVDLDRDQDRDLAMAGFGPVAISFFRNDGGLSFGRRHDLAAGSDPRSVDARDLDRDGDLDLAVRSSTSGEMTFFWNDGAPDFRRATFHVLSGDSVELELVDLDLDGLVDIAAASNALRVEWGEGPGRFGAVLEVPGPEWLRSLELGDLDGDGRLDVAGAGTGHILVYLSAGGRVLAPPRVVVTGSGPRAVNPADLDGDGDLDLAVALDSPAIQVCRNDGTGAFEALPPIALGSAQPTSIASADLDLDGAPDLMAPTMSPSAVFLLWNRGATFDVTPSAPLPWTPPFASAIDLDGDRDLDVLTTGFHVLDNRAGFEGVSWLMLSRADMPARTAAADLDGNGLPDLVSFTGSRSAIVLLNGSSPPAEPDVDRDGIPDGCERPLFHRGDALPDGTIDLADAISLLEFLFLGGEPLPCAEAADADNDGAVVVSDAIRILGFLFLGGPAPVSPGPATEPCGPDPDPAGSAGDLGCASYAPCL